MLVRILALTFLLFGPAVAGAAPPAKPAKLAGHEVVSADSGSPSTAPVQTAVVHCPLGLGVVSGGYAFSTTGIEDFILIDNHPIGQHIVQEPGGEPVVSEDGWLVTARRTDGMPDTWSVVAFAICVEAD